MSEKEIEKFNNTEEVAAVPVVSARTNEGNRQSTQSTFHSNRRLHFGRSRECPLKDVPLSHIVYYNLGLLSRYVSEYGRILSQRIMSSNNGVKHRKVAKAIRQARELGLITYQGKIN